MREFTCKKLGYECTWKHIAKTEELLADMVAVHLRDVHGVPAVTQETLGKIKNSFSNPSPLDASQAEGLALKEYRCSLGPGCTWHYIAQTEELIVDGVAVHAREVHGIREFTPDMAARVKTTAKAWKGPEGTA
jgi:predicted small metal-binding protein